MSKKSSIPKITTLPLTSVVSCHTSLNSRYHLIQWKSTGRYHDILPFVSRGSISRQRYWHIRSTSTTTFTCNATNDRMDPVSFLLKISWCQCHVTQALNQLGRRYRKGVHVLFIAHCFQITCNWYMEEFFTYF